MLKRLIAGVLVMLAAAGAAAAGEGVGLRAEADSEMVYGDHFRYAVRDDGTSVLCGCNDDCTDMVIPPTLDGRRVTAIGLHSFESKQELKSVSIPITVTTIKDHAFYDCIKMKSVVIPASVKELDWGAFGYYWKPVGEFISQGTQMDDFTIYCYKGTEAERYAKELGFDHVLLKRGDVNRDKKVDIADLTAVAAHSKNIRKLGDSIPADVNGDGEINLIDVAMIAAHVKNIEKLE